MKEKKEINKIAPIKSEYNSSNKLSIISNNLNTIKADRAHARVLINDLLKGISKYAKNIKEIEDNIPQYYILRLLSVFKQSFIFDMQVAEQAKNNNKNILKESIRSSPILFDYIFEFQKKLPVLSSEKEKIFNDNVEEIFKRFIVEMATNIEDEYKSPIFNFLIERFEMYKMLVPESMIIPDYTGKATNYLKGVIERANSLNYEIVTINEPIILDISSVPFEGINDTTQQKIRPTLPEMFKDEKKLEIICEKLITNGFATTDENNKIKWIGKTLYSFDKKGIDDGYKIQLVALSLIIKEKEYLRKVYYDTDIHYAFTEYFNIQISLTMFKKANSHFAEYYKNHFDFI